VTYTQQLHQLQQLDTQIMNVQKRLAEIAASLVESDALRSVKAVFNEAAKQQKAATSVQKDLELEVGSLQQKIAANEQRLYSGKVTNPKEAGSLQDEIASSKRWLTKREEDLLEAMIQTESAEETYQKIQRRLTAVEADWAESQHALRQEQADLQANLELLQKNRTATAQMINKRDLADYEKLRSRLGGIGLAEVENDICSACGVMLSSRLVQQVRSEGRHHYCEMCGRILHVL
jgi:predicted  nucleic acid-binding Zn-ribbon protein